MGGGPPYLWENRRNDGQVNQPPTPLVQGLDMPLQLIETQMQDMSNYIDVDDDAKENCIFL